MKKIFVVLFTIVITVNLFCNDSQIKIAVYGFDSPTYKAESISQYTKYLESLLFDSKDYLIVDRQNLQTIIEEKKLSLSGLVNNEGGAEKIGELTGAQYMVSGTIDRAENGYLVSIKIIDLKNGVISFLASKTTTRVYKIQKTIDDIMSMVIVKNGEILKGEIVLKSEPKIENEAEDTYLLEYKDGRSVKAEKQYKNYKRQAGVLFPAYGFEIKNRKKQTQGFWGPNALLGITYKYYFQPLAVNEINVNWQVGTVELVMPHAGIGADYIFENGFFVGAGCYIATWAEYKQVTTTKDFDKFEKEDMVELKYGFVPMVSIGVNF